jgi:hypothetical protein
MGSLTEGKWQEAEGREISRCVRKPALLLPARSFLLFPFYVLLALAAGCNYFNRAPSAGSDPLLGGPPAPAAGKPTQQQPAVPVTALPPLAAPSSASSPAALAAGPTRSLDNGRDLRIGNPQANSGTDGWVGREPNPQRNGSGAMLLGVQPSAELAARTDSPSVFNPVSLPGSQVTMEQAQKILANPRVLWQRPQRLDNDRGYQFSCAVQNRQNPTLNRIYTATAPDLLGAMRAVIEQIDKEQ